MDPVILGFVGVAMASGSGCALLMAGIAARKHERLEEKVADVAVAAAGAINAAETRAALAEMAVPSWEWPTR